MKEKMQKLSSLGPVRKTKMRDCCFLTLRVGGSYSSACKRRRVAAQKAMQNGPAKRHGAHGVPIRRASGAG